MQGLSSKHVALYLLKGAGDACRVVYYLRTTPVGLIQEFVNEFDPVIKGWGTDVWYTQFFGPKLATKQAVADCVTAVNPPERTNGKREILDYLGSDDERKNAWYAMVEKKHLKSKTPPPGADRKGLISDLSWPC